MLFVVYLLLKSEKREKMMNAHILFMFIGLTSCVAHKKSSVDSAIKKEVTYFHVTRESTRVNFTITHPTQPILGFDRETSQISFTDDQGNDLFKTGAMKKKNWEKENPTHYSHQVNGPTENCISKKKQETFHNTPNPNLIILRASANTQPSAKSEAVLLKGTIDIWLPSKKIQTATLTLQDIKSGQTSTVGNHKILFKRNGFGGGKHGEYTYYSIQSTAEIKSAQIDTTKAEVPTDTIVSFYVSKDLTPKVKVYDNDLPPDTEVIVTYIEKVKESVPINFKIGPRFDYLYSK